jgi:hypothetical protein
MISRFFNEVDVTWDFFGNTGENFQIFECRKNCYLNLRAPKKFCMQLVSKVSFFYSADLPTRCARAANFPSRKKKYYFTHLLHK